MGRLDRGRQVQCYGRYETSGPQRRHDLPSGRAALLRTELKPESRCRARPIPVLFGGSPIRGIGNCIGQPPKTAGDGAKPETTLCSTLETALNFKLSLD